jgi:hypothetical protein
MLPSAGVICAHRRFSSWPSSASRCGASRRPTPKLDRILSVRARQFTGRSRVIVEFYGAPDVRAITAAHGVVARTLRGRPAQVADIGNLDLPALAKDPRVAG